MNAFLFRILFLLFSLCIVTGLCCYFTGCKKSPAVISSDNDNNASALCVIEVREGGGMQPEPHPVLLSIYNDGLIRNRNSEHYVDKKDVEQLIEQIAATKIFEINQTQFDTKLREAGEFDRSFQGGSGVYTISLESDGVTHRLQLNQPELYSNSTVIPARRFLEVLTMIKDFAAQQ